jgi:dolichol-phosphate mannosyltransferase
MVHIYIPTMGKKVVSMKKDNFISVGLVLKGCTETSQIEDLHKILNDKYNYFEILILNTNIDGNDRNKKLLKQLSNLRIIELASYVDIEVAHTVLIENCIGDYCSIIDLAHDSLTDFENMLEKVENYDVIIGKREKKVQSFFESITSKFFYKSISLFTGIKINSMYSDFFVINRKVINFITKNEDRVKFLKLIKFNNGFSRYEYSYMPVGNKSNKRTFFENVNFTIDVLVNYSHRLIRMATILSLITSFVNLFYIIYVLGSYLLKDNIAQGWTSSSLYSSAMYFILFLVLAVIGEYIRMIMQNQKNTPFYEITDEKSSISLFSTKKNVDNE